VSNIIKANNIEPYIWMSGNMKELAKETLSEKKSFAVPGIACLPELRKLVEELSIKNCINP
jgi:hypothetical protein